MKKLELIVQCNGQRNNDFWDFLKTPQYTRSKLTCALCQYDPLHNKYCTGYEPIMAYRMVERAEETK